MRIAFAALALAGCAYFTPEVTARRDVPVDDAPATPTLNRCAPSAWVDRRDETADRTVVFGGEGGAPALGYAPACLWIRAGQTVTFRGAFAAHPMEPGVAEGDPSRAARTTPLSAVTEGSERAVRFDNPGLHPYVCARHRALGMFGVVRVE